MKINWKRIIIVAICCQVISFIIMATRGYAGVSRSTANIIDIISLFIIMFSGGLLVARKIEARFLFHGFLLGVTANLLFIPQIPIYLALFTLNLNKFEPDPERFRMLLPIVALVKILICMAGTYVGGKIYKSNNEEISDAVFKQ